jgi:hypothetical protein
LKEGFEFGDLVRRTHENVLAEMLKKVLAYNISRIIRLRKKLSEPQEIQKIAAQSRSTVGDPQKNQGNYAIAMHNKE